MSTTSVVAPAETSAMELRRLQDMGFRPVEGGFRHSACRGVVQDPYGHHDTCEIGKIKARGYLPLGDEPPFHTGGYLHIACQSRTDDMDVHDRECRVR